MDEAPTTTWDDALDAFGGLVAEIERRLDAGSYDGEAPAGPISGVIADEPSADHRRVLRALQDRAAACEHRLRELMKATASELEGTGRRIEAAHAYVRQEAVSSR